MHLNLAREVKSNPKQRFGMSAKKGKIPPPVGLEPTTFELEETNTLVHCATGAACRGNRAEFLLSFFSTAKHQFIFLLSQYFTVAC